MSCYWRDVTFVFFFQAEDGIRDVAVTGVQTCALPISPLLSEAAAAMEGYKEKITETAKTFALLEHSAAKSFSGYPGFRKRSEERRVGKECRSRWSPYH